MKVEKHEESAIEVSREARVVTFDLEAREYGAMIDEAEALLAAAQLDRADFLLDLNIVGPGKWQARFRSKAGKGRKS